MGPGPKLAFDLEGLDRAAGGNRAAPPVLLPCCNSALRIPPARSPQQQTVGQLLTHVRQLCDRLEAQAEVSYVQADGTKVRRVDGDFATTLAQLPLLPPLPALVLPPKVAAAPTGAWLCLLLPPKR